MHPLDRGRFETMKETFEVGDKVHVGTVVLVDFEWKNVVYRLSFTDGL